MSKAKVLASAALALASLAAVPAAHAGGVHWSIGINLPPVGVAVGAPVYAPAPVYVPPAPVYYEPPPVYRPAPVYYRPAPVYYRPAPVYYGPPRVVYERGHGPRGDWHRGHGHGRDWDRDGRR